MNGKKYGLAELIRYFEAWGVDDAQSWASSQVKEGINQYARLVFLRGAWQCVIGDGDTTWIDNTIARAKRDPAGPGAGAGHSLERLLEGGANRDDLSEVTRVMQYEVLHRLLYLLSDPDSVAYPSGNVPAVNWALLEIDENGVPIGDIDALYESVLATDPSGREMMPRSRATTSPSKPERKR